MKKLVLSAFLFLLTVSILPAQQAEDFTGSLLWKISGNGLEKPSYVFGTYHLYGKELLEKIPALQEAIDTTEQVAGELLMDDMQGMQTLLGFAALLPEEESYRKLLSDDEYQRLDQGLISSIGVGLDQLGALRPGMITASLAQVMHLQIDPTFNPMSFEGIDQYLQRIAKENNKPRLGLEVIQDQINLLFHASSQREQMLSLLCAVEHYEEGLDALKFMAEHYLLGKIYEIYDASFNNPDEVCSEYTLMTKDALLKNRNDQWVEKLPAIMGDKPTLIVVGALHLAAEEGILYQLAQLGYRVEAVK